MDLPNYMLRCCHIQNIMTVNPLVKIMEDLTNCSDYCKPRAFTADRSAGSLSLQGVHGGATLVSKLKITYLKQERPHQRLCNLYQGKENCCHIQAVLEIN